MRATLRVLVTGAAGFIGRHVVAALEREKHEIFAAVRGASRIKSSGAGLSRAQVVEMDLESDAEVRGAIERVSPEIAIHLAWYAVPGVYWTSRENLECVIGGLRLARALADCGCKRLVAAGSCAEYEWKSGVLSEEGTPLAPRTLYGACKCALRQMLERFCAQASMELAWTRLFYLYGPGEKQERLVPSVILPLLRGETARCTRGEQARDFLYVEDAAEALVAVAISDFAGAVNIGSGEPVKVKTVVETIARVLGRGERVAFGALPENPGDPPKLIADVQRLNRDVGWKASRTLEEGLAKTVDWWKAREGARV